MDGEANGTQEAQGGTQVQAQDEQKTSQQVDEGKGGNAGPDYERQISERDERIAALEAQVAEAAKNAEAAEQLRGEIANLKQQSEDARVDFTLQLAGCRNVKAARAVLSDYDGDVEKLKAGEPWLFGKGAGADKGGSGKTGLPNAGAATDEGKQLKHWREIAGLTDGDKE